MQQFHAFEVLPGKTHKLTIPDGSGFHLSVVTLPQKSNGQTTLYAIVDGKSYAIATVDSGRGVFQVATDLIFNFEQEVSFTAKGSAAVHCVGYVQELDMDDEFPLGMMEESVESDEEASAPRLPIEDAEDPTAPEGESVSDDEEMNNSDDLGEEEEESDIEEEGVELDSDEEVDDVIDEEDDDDEEDDEEEEAPVRKSARMEGQSHPSQRSPVKNAGSVSPQGRRSQMSKSPQASPQGRRSGSGRKSGSMSQGRKSH